MKWLLALVCLSCGENPAPHPIVVVDTRAACDVLAQMALADALKMMPPGTAMAAACIPQGEDDEEIVYPQRKGH